MNVALDGFKEFAERLLSKIGLGDAKKLKKLEAQLVRAEKILGKLRAARDEHRNNSPMVMKATVDYMTIDQLLEAGREGNRGKSNPKHDAWFKVDKELFRRVGAANKEVCRLRDAIARCKWQPVKKYGDGLADKVVSAWREMEESLDELQQVQRLETEIMGLAAHARFNPRSVSFMKEAVENWADNRNL